MKMHPRERWFPMLAVGLLLVVSGAAVVDIAPPPDWWTAPTDAALAVYPDLATGDFNGDGAGDFAVAVGDTSPFGLTAWVIAYAYHGSLAGPSTTQDWAATHERVATNYLTQIDGAGDIDGDGYDDLILGILAYDPHVAVAAETMIYYGWTTGLTDTPAPFAEGDGWYDVFGVAGAGDVNGDGYADVLVGAAEHSFDDATIYAYLGSASGVVEPADWQFVPPDPGGTGTTMAAAGDVNGDGYDDVIVANPYYGNDETLEGAAYLFLGSAAGLPVSPDWEFETDVEGARFGTGVGAAGDVNGDGYDDVIVGASHRDDAGSGGAAYVFYGSASGPASAPVELLESSDVGAQFGAAVASAGDINDDGYDDVIVGAPGFANGENGEGSAAVFLGSASGLVETAVWTAQSNAAGGALGAAVAATDLNADGNADVLVVTPGMAAAKGSGRVLAFFGPELEGDDDTDDDTDDDSDDDTDDDSDDDADDDSDDDMDDDTDDDADDDADDDIDDDSDDEGADDDTGGLDDDTAGVGGNFTTDDEACCGC